MRIKEMVITPERLELRYKLQLNTNRKSGPAIHCDPRDYYATKPEAEKSKMATSEFEMNASPLVDKISTKFQRLHLYFRGPASHWNTRKYYSTKQEVRKSKLADLKLEMYLSPIPDKISTKFQRLYLCFRSWLDMISVDVLVDAESRTATLISSSI